MKALTHHSAHQSTAFNTAGQGFSLQALWHKFTNWASLQQKNRLLWVAISLVGHTTVFTIATFITVIITGNQFPLLVSTIFTMAMVVIVNLAALPTKYTIPVFFLSLLIDAVIISAAVWGWMH
ncbi:hypothetical protein [Ferruginibacter sp.]